MSVSADEYEEKMNAEAQFKLTATCRVVESQRLLATSEAFSLRRPALEFEVSSCFVQLRFEPQTAWLPTRLDSNKPDLAKGLKFRMQLELEVWVVNNKVLYAFRENSQKINCHLLPP